MTAPRRSDELRHLLEVARKKFPLICGGHYVKSKLLNTSVAGASCFEVGVVVVVKFGGGGGGSLLLLLMLLLVLLVLIMVLGRDQPREVSRPGERQG